MNFYDPQRFKQTMSSSTSVKDQKNEKFNGDTPSSISNGVSSITPLLGSDVDLALPTKVFRAKKTSVNDLSQGQCSYLWFRRFKEIFLLMGNQNDAFSRFDMDLARNDMIETCDQYLESERPKGGGINLVCCNICLSLKYKCFCPFSFTGSKSSSHIR